MSNKTRKKQIENQTQQGRSMVEMLGVLAIIGVISIGGIAGYRMAMNRYQANQIANEINLMRTDAKMKVAQGAENLMLGEPYDSGHLNFGSNYGVEFNFAVFSEAGEPEESGYYIKVAGVPAGVCKPLVTLLEGMDDAIAVVVNEQENNADSSVDLCTEESNNALEVDFSTKDIGGVSGGNSDPEVTDPADEPQDEPECNEDTCPGECNEEGVCECSEENEHWTGTDCITCPAGTTWSETERDCVCSDGKYWTGYQCVDCGSNEWDEENKECKCDEGKYWSDSAGACIENPCNKNGQGCEAGKFCLSSGCSDTCSNSQMTEEDSCKNGTYKCEKIDSYKAENKDTEHPDKYVMSKSSMNWWSAERFCKAQHKHMVSATELKCKDKFGENFGYSKSNTWCYCHNDESEKTCTQSSTSEVSSVIKALRKAENGSETSGSKYYWLDDAYANTTSSRDSCRAYSVTLYNGNVTSSNRYSSGGSALCE